MKKNMNWYMSITVSLLVTTLLVICPLASSFAQESNAQATNAVNNVIGDPIHELRESEQEKEKKAEKIADKTKSLKDIRKAARENMSFYPAYVETIEKYKEDQERQESQLGDKRIRIDEEGKEIVEFELGTVERDRTDRIEDLEDTLQEYKDSQEDQAINLYDTIISKNYEIELKENAIELAKINEVIQQVSYDQGLVTLVEWEDAKQQVKTEKEQLDQLQKERADAYDSLNKVTGYPKDTSYPLSTEGMGTKIQLDDKPMYVPENAISFAKEHKKELVDLREEVEEKSEQIDRYVEQNNNYGSESYDEVKDSTEIEKLEKDLTIATNNQYFDMEKTYQTILTDLIMLTIMQEEVNLMTYQSSIMDTKLDLGVISKKQWYDYNNQWINKKKDLDKKYLSIYLDVVAYERENGLSDPK